MTSPAATKPAGRATVAPFRRGLHRGCEFTDTDLHFGSMSGARKGADLERDPRFALHGPTFRSEEGKEKDWPGEAKVAGRAIRATPVISDEVNDQPAARCSLPTSLRSSSRR